MRTLIEAALWLDKQIANVEIAIAILEDMELRHERATLVTRKMLCSAILARELLDIEKAIAFVEEFASSEHIVQVC
jgi:hypothetical protein